MRRSKTERSASSGGVPGAGGEEAPGVVVPTEMPPSALSVVDGCPVVDGLAVRCEGGCGGPRASPHFCWRQPCPGWVEQKVGRGGACDAVSPLARGARDAGGAAEQQPDNDYVTLHEIPSPPNGRWRRSTLCAARRDRQRRCLPDRVGRVMDEGISGRWRRMVVRRRVRFVTV